MSVFRGLRGRRLGGYGAQKLSSDLTTAWSAYDKHMIQLRQQQNQRLVAVPVHRALKEALVGRLCAIRKHAESHGTDHRRFR